MAAEHIAALDAGTSGVRCAILRPGAGIIASARREWHYHTPPGGSSLDKSFDPEAFWSTACEATRSALTDAGLTGGDVAAVGVTSQRLGIVVIDDEGTVVLASPNVDARAFMEGIAIDGRMADRVYASTGKLPSLLLAPARLHWLRKHDEPAYARADCVLAIADWLAFRLTGERKSERVLAGECGLLDVTSRERNGQLLSELDVPAGLLAPLVSSDETAGHVSKQGAEVTGLAEGTPVVVAGGDTQCALLGMGVEEPGEAGIAAGWSCPLQQVTAEPRFDVQRRTWAGLHGAPERWVVESSATDAGRMWRWWAETLLGEGPDILERAAALAGEAPAGSGEASALLGPGAMNASAMGLHLGGLLMTTPLAIGTLGRPHLLRAAIENIAYALRANLEQAEEVSGIGAARIAAGGGLTRSPIVTRIIADVVARPIEVAHDVEVTARGAARMAARAVGMEAVSPGLDLHTVEPDEAAAEGYQRRYERWRKLASALDETMRGMS